MSTPLSPDLHPRPIAVSVEPSTAAPVGPDARKLQVISLTIALAGGGVTLVTYFVLPLLDVAGTNITANGIVNVLDFLYPLGCSGQTAISICPPFNPSIMLWTSAASGAIVVLLAVFLWLTRVQSNRRAALIGSIGLPLVGVIGAAALVYGLTEAYNFIAVWMLIIGGVLTDNPSAGISMPSLSIFQHVSVGFWVMIGGLAATVVGGIMHLLPLTRRRTGTSTHLAA